MKRVYRGVMGLLLAPAVFLTAITSSSFSISAYADDEPIIEIAAEATEPSDTETLDNETSTTEDTSSVNVENSTSTDVSDESEISGEAQETVSEEIAEELTEEVSEELTEEAEVLEDVTDVENGSALLARSPRQYELYYDACFYIRGNGIDAAIPEEPKGHDSSHYSRAIRVNDAVASSSLKYSTCAVDGSEDSLLDDSFTADNSITQMLTFVPEADAIKKAVPGFDEKKHYVVWYVVKGASCAFPNQDVNIHVDGVIRTRVNPVSDEPQPEPVNEYGFTASEEQELIKLAEEYEIQIETLYLDENGNPAPEIFYDGKEHIIGGFAINVISKNNHSLIDMLKFNWKGEQIVYAADDCTLFEVAGRTFSVNITGAYAKARSVGEAVVEFYRGSQVVPKEEVTVSDEKGRPISAYFNIRPVSGNVKVSQRELTIKAGVSVRNDVGQTLTDGTYEILSGKLAEGHTLHVVIVGSRTGPGQSLNEITSYQILDENGADVTKMYNVTTKPGLLKLVTPTSSEEKAGDNSEVPTDAAAIYRTIKKIDANGKTSFISVPYQYGSSNTSSGTAAVLGARRAATGDDNSAMLRILMIISSLIVLMTASAKGKQLKK